MKKTIFSLIKIALLVILVVVIAAIVNYAFQFFYISPRYWDGTVARSNERVAITTKNFIELYGSEKFASLDPAQITRDYSSLGYNLNILIVKNDNIVAKSTYYPTSKTIEEQKIHYQIDCSKPDTNEKCSIIILEETKASARSLDANYIAWIKNWFSNPQKNLEPKYDNITWPFSVALSSSMLIAISILGWYFYADKKKKALWEKEEENRKQDEEIKLLKGLLGSADEEIKTTQKKVAEEELARLNLEINSEEIERQKNILEERIADLEEKIQKDIKDKRVILNAFYPNIEFSKKSLEQFNFPNNSVFRKLTTYLRGINDGNPNPIGNRKQFHGFNKDVLELEDVPGFEYDISGPGRLFVHFPPGSKPLVASIWMNQPPYHH